MPAPKPRAALAAIAVLLQLISISSFARVRNQSNKGNITTQEEPREPYTIGVTQTTSVTSEKGLFLNLRPYFQNQKESIINLEAGTSVIPQNENHLKNNTHLFGGGYGYSTGTFGISGNGSFFWGINNNKSKTKGVEGKLVVDYFHIDEEMQDPNIQKTSSLAYLHNDLSHEILPPQEQAKFWLKVAFCGTIFSQSEIQENSTSTAVQINGYYPITQSFSAGLDSYLFNYSSDNTEVHSTYNVFQTRALGYSGQTISRPLNFASWGIASWKITRWDRLVGKPGLLVVKNRVGDTSNPLGVNLALGWEHFWQIHWSLKPTYEISFLHNQTNSGIRIDWGLEF